MQKPMQRDASVAAAASHFSDSLVSHSHPVPARACVLLPLQVRRRKAQMRKGNIAVTLVLLSLTAGCSAAIRPEVRPEGRETTVKTDVLRAGAAALQTDSPLEGMNIYLVGFHPMKNDPSHQMTAHHFCRQVNEDFAQCALFDGNTKDANLNGIEFIISEKLFGTLSREERKYWHPHNGEILSGQLVAPGIPEVAEKELMRGKMNSYGKTWHVWATDHGQKLPLGDPMLAWSFNKFGQANPGLVEEVHKNLGIDTEATRRNRQDLVPLAKPQEGVDALAGQFKGPTRPIPGVIDQADVSASKR
jgi:hypothetical protein